MMMVTLHDQEEREEHEAEDAERRWTSYLPKEGVRRRHARAMRGAEPVNAPEPSTLAEYTAALEAHGETLAALKDTARRLPRGSQRWQAVELGLSAGFRKAEMARLLGVSPQRITEMLSQDEIPL